MTIEDTRKVLTFLWGCFPSAPKLSRDDKDRMILSFFRVLYKYDLNDVINAVIDACKGSKGFVPSAFELEARVKPTIPELKFDATERERFLYNKYKYTNVFGELQTCTDGERCAEMQEFIDIYPQLMRSIKCAQTQALSDYYAANTNAASKDLKRLGVVDDEEITTNRLK